MSRLENSKKNVSTSLVFFIINMLMALVSRKLFIEAFGNDIIGLNSTMTNIIGFLNLAELGVIGAIATGLYKPIFDDNKKDINNIISIFGYFYRKIGLIILILGVVISLFLPLFFKDKGVDMIYVYAVFITYLGSTLITYFISYRQVLLDGYQKNYITTIGTNISLIIKVALQIIIIKFFTDSYMLWLALELLFGFIYGFWINSKVKKYYPWLKTSIKEGKENIKNYPALIKITKDIIPHKLGTFILGQTDNILIFAFTSLKTVTLYTNYYMIVSKIILIASISVSGMNSIIGNLIVSKDEKKIREVYQILQIFFFSGAAILIITCFFLIDSFVNVWLGDGYILDKNILIFLLLNTYIGIIRIPTEMYKTSYVIFHDRWAAYAEAAINLVISIVLGYLYGLIGVMLGTFVSLFLIVILWKPIILYREGFKESVWIYWKRFFIYLIIGAVGFIAINLFTTDIYRPEINNLWDWTLYGAVIFSLTSVVVLALTFIFCKESKLALSFIKHLLRNRH